MSTHNIQFHDKIRKKSLNICFLLCWKDFVGTEKRVRIIHGKRAIRVRAIEVILYFPGIIGLVLCLLTLVLTLDVEQSDLLIYIETSKSPNSTSG